MVRHAPRCVRLDAKTLDELGRRRPSILPKHAGKVARAHPGLLGQHVHGQIAMQIVGHPGPEVGDLLSVRRLERERRTELRLPAGSAQMEHHLTRHAQRQRRSEIFLHQRQREVHPRGDTRGCVGIAIADVDGIRVDRHPRKPGCQIPRPFPVRNSAFAVQEPGRPQEEGAGAHGSDAAHPRCDLAEPIRQLGASSGRFDARASRNEKRVDRPAHIPV